MHRVGELFVYGRNGACKITDIKTQKFGNSEKMYYILSPVFDMRETIFVPVDNELLVSKMKKMLTKEEIIALIKSIPQRENLWIENVKIRREEYKKIISKANRDDLVSLMKTLYMRRKELELVGKSLSVYDEKFFRQAESIIHGEISLVLEIPREEVPPYIQKTINEAA